MKTFDEYFRFKLIKEYEVQYMNEKAKSVVKNLYYTVAANFATLGISVLLN